ncbi:MAG: ATP-binding protein [Candidatus Thiosymbion ectosymbiont of Robbea hypermnestra]|nr:ATP-binding protein [Candidatus Thiosymbion ectosymbiont of Robbea hypermnestra]
MTPTQAIGYVLRRLWFWPLILWLRPSEVADRLRKRPGLELTTAILGSGLWGALAGVSVWLWTGDPQAIWVLTLAVAIAGAGAGAGVFVIVIAVTSTVAGAGAVAGVGIDTLGIALVVALGVGAIVGFFFDNTNGLVARQSRRDLRIAAQAQVTWLMLSWVFFPPLAIAVYVLSPQAAGLDAKLELLALFLGLTPLVLTGLPAWPLTAALALWQYRSHPGQDLAPDQLARTIAFRWQSFAYPLPGLAPYLIRLGRDAGPAAALGAIQAVQRHTLQQAAARRAIRELASDPATALPFCGRVALETNSATLADLARIGATGQTVAALAAKHYKENWEPLQLDVGRIRRGRALRILGWKSEDPDQARDAEAGLAWIRERPLSERILYAQKRLEELGEAVLVPEYRELLDALEGLAGLSDLRRINQLPPGSGSAPGDDSWLAGGWAVIRRAVRIALSDLERYSGLTTKTARRRLLEAVIGRLRGLGWEKVPAYWRDIAEELVDHWAGVLEVEARRAREWLRLEVAPLAEHFVPGDQTLRLRVRNPTGEPALKGEIRMKPTAGLAWAHKQAQLGLLEGGKETLVPLDFRTEAAGALRIQGELTARDLENNPFSLDFAFQIQVAAAGRTYRIPDYQPYVMGEGLGDDRTFVGREDLLGWLRGLWLQPGGKPAVVLVGQRRIGKTSLLNKIERAGLPGTNLLGLTLNIQGMGSEYDFLNETATRLAERLELPTPSLDRTEPYADFKTFLRDVRGPLGDRRFLLMLDEADLLPERRLGEGLPGFLRALMQEHRYPTVLLFCGTTRLRAMARDYFSILFNTAQFRTLSYLTPEESAQVLRQPARNILEYDPAVLADAYRLTRGQPLLLQMLGAALINRFGEQVRRGETRSDYVDTNDFAAAIEGVVQAETNAAFENHWDDSDAATHRVLSALAWATDETDRPQLAIAGLESAMAETRLSLPRERTFQILERLADDEILERDGPTYRFWVPLYRRWIAWRWPPERVREEGTGVRS